MHSAHPVRVTVADATSAAPSSNVQLAVSYDYDSYGWFHFFNVPPNETATTDANGVAVMKLADFRYRILLKVNGGAPTTLNKQLITEGGAVAVPPYRVVLSPG